MFLLPVLKSEFSLVTNFFSIPNWSFENAISKPRGSHNYLYKPFKRILHLLNVRVKERMGIAPIIKGLSFCHECDMGYIRPSVWKYQICTSERSE